MIDYILSLPGWIGCVFTMVFTAVFALVIYAISQKVIEKYKAADLKDSMTSLFRMVGIFVSLMLSLAFGEVITEWWSIKNAIDREAAAIQDTYFNLEYYDSEATREMQAILIDYAQAVIDDDWPAMANDRLGQRTSALIRQLSKRVLNLKPKRSLQRELRSGIMADIDTMSDYRLIRLNRSLGKPPVYILVIIFGFLVSMACFGAYRPHIPLIALLSLFTLFIGMVIYLIMAMSDPFQGGVSIDPIPIEYLVETLKSEFR